MRPRLVKNNHVTILVPDGDLILKSQTIPTHTGIRAAKAMREAYHRTLETQNRVAAL